MRNLMRPASIPASKRLDGFGAVGEEDDHGTESRWHLRKTGLKDRLLELDAPGRRHQVKLPVAPHIVGGFIQRRTQALDPGVSQQLPGFLPHADPQLRGNPFSPQQPQNGERLFQTTRMIKTVARGKADKARRPLGVGDPILRQGLASRHRFRMPRLIIESKKAEHP